MRNHYYDRSKTMKVFVYGSLLRGECNNRRLVAGDAKFVCAARTKPKYKMLSLGAFPGIVAGDNHILGEVFEVDEQTLASLDSLEGHPRFYKRTLDRVTDLTTGEAHWIWIYVLVRSPWGGERIVHSGYWRNREKNPARLACDCKDCLIMREENAQ